MQMRVVAASIALLVPVVASVTRAGDEKASTAPAPKAEPKLTVSGFLQTDYRLGDQAGQGALVKHEFNVRRARILVSGKVSDRVGYGLAVLGDGLNVNTGSVVDAFVDLTFKPLAKLRAGQFKFEFDMQGREPAPLMPFADRPFVTNAVAGSMDGASTASTPAAAFRDRGVSLCGDSAGGGVTWGYALGLYQGSGRASDNNNDFGYMLNVHVFPVKDLKVNGGYFSSNSRNLDAAAPNDHRAWTVGASYDAKKAMLRAEYYDAERDRGSVSQAVKGYYVLGTYAALSKLDLMARYQAMKDGQFAPGADRVHSVDLGAKWYLARQGRRGGTHVALNYMIRGADKGFNKGLTLLDDGRGAALTSGGNVRGVLMVRLQAQF